MKIGQAIAVEAFWDEFCALEYRLFSFVNRFDPDLKCQGIQIYSYENKSSALVKPRGKYSLTLFVFPVAIYGLINYSERRTIHVTSG